MRILELFAGIGACSKALKRIGINIEIVDAVENDKYAMASFNAIHNTNFEVQDITTWNKDLKDIDLITHGSPCQDFSVAGKQAGGDLGSGTRSSLMYETIRIVGQVRPKYVLWENVKNILSKKHKHNFDAYIETMNVLGYNSYYKVLDAKDYGVPQHRERVFTISIRKDIDSGYKFPETVDLKTKVKDALEDKVDEKYYLKEKGLNYVSRRMGTYTQIIDDSSEIAQCPITAVGNTNWTGNFVLDKNNVGFKFPEPMELKLRLKDVLEDEVEEKYYLSNAQIERIKTTTYNVGKTRIQEKDYCDTLCARDWKDPKCVQVGNLQGGNTEPKVSTMANDSMGVVQGIKVIGNYMPSNYDASRIVDSNGLAPTVKENHGTVTAIIEGQSGLIQPIDRKYKEHKTERKEHIEFKDDNCSHALRTSVVPITCNNFRIRKLTPKECWRLMRIR